MHDLAAELKIIFVAGRTDGAMQNRHRAIRGIPIGINSPKIMHLRRIALPAVSDTDNPLEGGKTSEFGELHFASERGLVVLPSQRMRAGLVILPITRLDVRRFNLDPFATAPLAASKREGQVGNVTLRVGTSLPQKKMFPLRNERHLSACRF